jgi:hypothetical protein
MTTTVTTSDPTTPYHADDREYFVQRYCGSAGDNCYLTFEIMFADGQLIYCEISKRRHSHYKMRDQHTFKQYVSLAKIERERLKETYELGPKADLIVADLVAGDRLRAVRVAGGIKLKLRSNIGVRVVGRPS